MKHTELSIEFFPVVFGVGISTRENILNDHRYCGEGY